MGADEDPKKGRKRASGAKVPASASHADGQGDVDERDRETAGLSYEEALGRLETIIERVEHGEIGLEETLEQYRRGRALLRRCQGILDTAEQEIRRLSLGDLERQGSGAADGSRSTGRRADEGAVPDDGEGDDAPF